MIWKWWLVGSSGMSSGPRVRAAAAIVELDRGSGTGFVSTAALRHAFRWNDRDVHARAADVRFCLVRHITEPVPATAGLGTDPAAVATVVRTIRIRSDIVVDLRQPVGTVSGHRLTGWGSRSSIRSLAPVLDGEDAGAAGVTAELLAISDGATSVLWRGAETVEP